MSDKKVLFNERELYELIQSTTSKIKDMEELITPTETLDFEDTFKELMINRIEFNKNLLDKLEKLRNSK